jgi:hypothetical protein
MELAVSVQQTKILQNFWHDNVQVSKRSVIIHHRVTQSELNLFICVILW